MTAKVRQIDYSGGDEFVIGLSACCLVHCVTWPFLLAAAPGLFSPANGITHQVLGCVSMLFSLVILGAGYDHHRDRLPILLGVAGTILFSVNVILPMDCCSAVNAWASGAQDFSDISVADWSLFLIAPTSTLLLISAHLWNRQLTSPQNRRKRKR